MKSCECFGTKVVRRLRYVVWTTPGHRERPWAVGREVRPACLKVAAYVEPKRLADALADRLTDGDLCFWFGFKKRYVVRRKLEHRVFLFCKRRQKNAAVRFTKIVADLLVSFG